VKLSDKEVKALVDATEMQLVERIYEVFGKQGFWDVEFDTNTIHGDGPNENGVRVILHATSSELIRWANPDVSNDIAQALWKRWQEGTEKRHGD